MVQTGCPGASSLLPDFERHSLQFNPHRMSHRTCGHPCGGLCLQAPLPSPPPLPAPQASVQVRVPPASRASLFSSKGGSPSSEEPPPLPHPLCSFSQGGSLPSPARWALQPCTYTAPLISASRKPCGHSDHTHGTSCGNRWLPVCPTNTWRTDRGIHLCVLQEVIRVNFL